MIAITGWGQDVDRRKSQEAGFDHHLVKPVEASDISALMSGATALEQHP
jgi:CheY-like chemotaxis protein